MQKALRTNPIYRETTSPALGDQMVTDPKLDMMQKEVEKTIKYIENPLAL